ncbi:MAG: DUF5667 domain-containing protein [Candidatus Geothermincolia bacterium]
MRSKKQITRTLPEAGKSLPPAKRKEELRCSVLESAGVDPSTVDQATSAPHAREQQGKARSKPFWRTGAFLIPVAAVCVVLALVITGFLSMNAMPGDALYPVKRLLQRTRVAVAFGSGAKVKANLSNADARLEELKYAKSRKMEDWYAPLAKSATSDLTQSIQGASSSREAERARKKLEEIRDLSKDIEPESDTGLQKALDGLEQQIDQKYQQSF